MTDNLDAEFGAWLARVCATEVPPSSVVAYNIGLIETEDGYSAYLSGTDTFDEEDADWACNETFTLEERYFAIAASNGEDWEEIQNAVIAAAKKFLTSPAGGRSFLMSAQAVTVGFDDGDLVRIR